MKKVISVILGVLIICAFSACSTKKNNEEILIISQNSPDGNYSVCLYQDGSPQWSFGSVGAKLVLKNSNGEILDKKEFALANDGAGVYEGNLKSVTWLDNAVEVLMDSDELSEEKYILNYADN